MNNSSADSPAHLKRAHSAVNAICTIHTRIAPQRMFEVEMSRGAQVFRQTDVTKAIRGAQNAGLSVHRFEIDKSGKIIVIAGKSDAPNNVIGMEANEWDSVK